MVVYKLDRFCRSTKDLWTTLEILEEHGVDFSSMLDQIDSKTANGRFLLNVLGSIAQMESEVNSERTKEALGYVASQGMSNGARIVGYRRNSDGILETHQKEADLVKLVFKKFKELKSAGSVLSYLNENGIRMPVYTTKTGKQRGGGPFNKQTILSWLENVKYIGKISFNGQIHEGKHEPIVERKLFNEVQTVLEANRTTKRLPRKRDRAYPLKGLLVCGKCGRKLTPKPSGGRGRSYPYYCCTRQIHQKGGCDLKAVPADAVEDLVVGYIRQIPEQRKLLDQITVEANHKAKEVLSEVKNQHSGSITTLKSIRKQIDNLIDVLASQGTNSSAAIQKKLNKLEQEERQLTKKEEDLRFEVNKANDRLCSSEVMIQSLKNFNQIVDGASGADLARIIPLFVKEIEWNQDEKDPTTGTMRVEFFEEFVPEEQVVTHEIKKAEDSVKHLSPARQVKLPGLDSNQ